MPSKIATYICKYTHHETLFPRHFIGDISSCMKVKELTIEEASRILSPEMVKQVLSGREVLIVEQPLIREIAEIDVASEYIVLKLVEE